LLHESRCPQPVSLHIFFFIISYIFYTNSLHYLTLFIMNCSFKMTVNSLLFLTT
jgi:hypothetical protein